MMGDDVFLEHMYAMKTKVDERDKQIKSLTERFHEEQTRASRLETDKMALSKRLHDKNVESEAECSKLKEHIQKFDEECTELHQRILTLGRTAEVKIDELKTDLVEATERVQELEADPKQACDRPSWSSAELEERIRILLGGIKDRDATIDKLRRTGGKAYLAKSRDYWKALAEKRQVEINELELCYDSGRAKIKYLRKRANKWFKRARMIRSKEKALEKELAHKQGDLLAYANKNERLHEIKGNWERCCNELEAKNEKLTQEIVVSPALDHHNWTKLMSELGARTEEVGELKADLSHAVKCGRGWFKKYDKACSELRDVKRADVFISPTDLSREAARGDRLLEKLKLVEAYHREYSAKTQKKLEVAEINQHHCHVRIAEMKASNEKLTTNRDTWAVESCDVKRENEKLVKQVNELAALVENAPTKDLVNELETERDHSAWLEKLLRALYGEGYNELTIDDATKFWDGLRGDLETAQNLASSRLNAIDDFRKSLDAINELADKRMKLIEGLRGDLETANELADHRLLASDDFKQHFETADKLAASRMASIETLQRKNAGLEWNYDQQIKEIQNLNEIIAELRE